MIHGNKRCIPLKEVRELWKIANDVYSGTAAMRKKKTKYLPKEDGETANVYKARLTRAVLNNVFKKTINNSAGLLLKNGIDINGLPENIMTYFDTIDSTGADLKTFAKRIIIDQCRYGIAYILSDMPIIPEGLTNEQKDVLELQPYLTRIDPLSIKDIFTVLVGSSEILVLFIYAFGCDDDNKTIYKRFMLIPAVEDKKSFVQWSTYTGEGKNEIIIEQGEIELPLIPIVPAYGSDTDIPFIAQPSLIDLMYKNIEHYQASADSRNAHHIANVPVMQVTGLKKAKRDEKGNQKETKFTLAGYTANFFEDNGSMSWVETSGQAMTQGREQLAMFEGQMENLSISFQTQTPDATATANIIGQASSESSISLIKGGLEVALRKSIKFMLALDGNTQDFELNLGESVFAGLTDSDMTNVKYLFEKNIIDDKQMLEVVNKRLPFELSYKPSILSNQGGDDVETDVNRINADETQNADNPVTE